VAALRRTGFTALIAFGLLLPLIGFNTVQNIRNELVLDTRWLLLIALVGGIALGRFVQLYAIEPWLARTPPLPFGIPPDVRRWAKPAVLTFVILYPVLAVLIAGPGAAKLIDNFGVQILIYVMLGWGLNIVVGFAGLLDLGYVAFYAIGAYTCALIGKHFGLSFLPHSGASCSAFRCCGCAATISRW
jgi:branched-chain amino acid transport system permease protein